MGLGFLNGGVHGNERVQFGDSEPFQHAWAHSRGNHPQAFGMAPDILADDHAQPIPIHVGNVGQVEDVNGRRLVRLGFEEAMHRFR
jgi:hypothetical protein